MKHYSFVLSGLRRSNAIYTIISPYVLEYSYLMRLTTPIFSTSSRANRLTSSLAQDRSSARFPALQKLLWVR
jgi:hypothetical protein